MIERKRSEDITIRLSRALQQGDSAMFTHELLALVKAHGVTAVAKRTGISRYSFYRYAAGDRPLLETALKMTRACGLKLVVVPDRDACERL